MTPTLLIQLFLLGIILCSSLLVSIELVFSPFKIVAGKQSPAMKLVGWAIMANVVSMSISDILVYLIPDEYRLLTLIIGGFFGCGMMVLILLSGYSLATGKYPHGSLTLGVSGTIFGGTIIPTIARMPIVWNSVILFTVVLFILIDLGFTLYRHDKDLTLHYGSTEGHTTRWFLLFAVFMLLLFPSYLLIHRTYNTPQWGAIIGYLINLAYVLFLAFSTYRHETETATMLTRKQSEMLNSETPTSTQGTSADGRVIFTPAQQQQLKNQIEHLMTVEKIYRDPKLSVDNLVKMLNTNSSYFYYFMRDVMQCRFFELVNGYRIEEAKKLLPSGLTMEAVAKECGFSSVNSFSRVFKSYVNQSPAQWRAYAKANPTPPHQKRGK